MKGMIFAYADPPYPGQARRHYRSRTVTVNVEVRFRAPHFGRYGSVSACETEGKR